VQELVAMNTKAESLKKRTKKFALGILRFKRTLPLSDEARDIGRQLTRAATAVGAGYRSACRSRSHAEFTARIGLVLDSADESLFWLEIIIEDGLASGPTVATLQDETHQLTSIFAASTITARENA
jgi:four helix bundle protein